MPATQHAAGGELARVSEAVLRERGRGEEDVIQALCAVRRTVGGGQWTGGEREVNRREIDVDVDVDV